MLCILVTIMLCILVTIMLCTLVTIVEPVRAVDAVLGMLDEGIHIITMISPCSKESSFESKLAFSEQVRPCRRGLYQR